MQTGFWSDDRGVSAVVGAVLVFAIIILLLSINQAEVVPAQNKAIEFSHSQAVQNDMIEIRNAILEAKTTGETTYAEIKLGTRYPSRPLAINPPPAFGRLATSEPSEIIIKENGSQVTGVCPGDNTYNTRFLTYEPDYNYYHNAPTIVYENTVLYLNFSGQRVLLSDQSLVQQDGTAINLAPINTSLSIAKVGMKSVEPVPGNTQSTPVDSGTVSLPTRLNESTWEDLLADQGIPDGNITVSDGRLNITTSAKVTVSCSPTGLNNNPEGGKQESGTTEINPAGPGDVLLLAQRQGSSRGVMEVKFENIANSSTNITRARFNFFQSDDKRNKQPDQIQIFNGTADSQNAGILPRGESYQVLDPDVFFPANDTRIIRLDLEKDNGKGVKLKNVKDGFFIITVRFETGETGTYFIPVPNDKTF